MEAGLNKLWGGRRRKSLKRQELPKVSEVPVIPPFSEFEYNRNYEAYVSGPAPTVGTFPIRPSQERKPRKLGSSSKAQSAGFHEFQPAIDTESHAKARSVGIQPVLVGISRPATAGSLHLAVLRAADTAVSGYSLQSHPVPQTSTTQSMRENKNPMQKRYVDIMSFAAAPGKPINAYNEDIAERNLDLIALAVKSTKHSHVSNSLYQEEVATRNALSNGSPPRQNIPLKGAMKDLSVDSHSDNFEGKVVMPFLRPVTEQGYRHVNSSHSTPFKTRPLQNTAAHHSRNASMTSKTSELLPSIPQDFSAEDGDSEAAIFAAFEDTVPVEELRRKGDSAPRPFASRYPSMHSHKAVSAKQVSATKTATRANEGRPLANGLPKETRKARHIPRDPSTLEYERSGANVLEPETGILPSGQCTGYSACYVDEKSFRSHGDLSSRGPSTDRSRALSAVRHRRRLSNRSFMDLTGDESRVADGIPSPELDYVESPTLEHAHADMLQFLRAQTVSAIAYNYQDEDSPAESDDDDDDDDDDDTLSGKSLTTPNSKRWWSDMTARQTYSGAFSDSGIHVEQPLSFSSVRTISSTSPTWEKNTPARKQPLMRFVGNPRPVPYRTESENAAIAEHAPFADIARRRRVPSRGVAPRKSAEGSQSTPRNSRKATSFYEDPTPPGTSYSKGEEQSLKAIHTSPDTLDSNDFTHPSREPGVLTRDFAANTGCRQPHQQPALSPSQQERVEPAKEQVRSHLRQDLDSMISAELRHKPRQIDHVETSPAELTASSFDEAEYARKQAHARAALVRLQMSLEEGYEAPPGRADSNAQRHVATQILGLRVNGEGRDKNFVIPMENVAVLHAPAPMSMYSRGSTKVKSKPKPQTNKPMPLEALLDNAASSASKALQQTTSFYSAVTLPQRTPSGLNTQSKTHSATQGHIRTSRPGTSASTKSQRFNPFFPPTSPHPASPLPPLAQQYQATNSTSHQPPRTPVSPSGFNFPSYLRPVSPGPGPERGRSATQELGPSFRPQTKSMHSQTGSTRPGSINSMASVYSIPFHMVPGRSSSLRDMEDMGRNYP